MTIDDLVAYVDDFAATMTMRPVEGDGSPEIAWGDLFWYYAPDGTLPQHTQPFATVVTKNYPGDENCYLERHGAFRVNMSVGADEFTARLGARPRDLAPNSTPVADDTLIAHPAYSSAGWVAVVNPGPACADAVRELLRIAYDRAVAAHHRKPGAMPKPKST